MISDYITEQKEIIEEIDMSFINHSGENSKWDEQYAIVNLSGEITPFGLAKKDNTVILFKGTSNAISIDNDFFNIAYENLF